MEAIKDRGQVHLEVREQGEMTLFAVSDSGGGVDERDRDLLFEPGFTTKFNDIGVAATGIGLSHVRDIVNMFEGEITVETDSKLGGAVFQVRIPTHRLRKED
ncbi:Sensor histidine kinase GlnK [compost metagenome]